ncbi:MAG: aminotransferase class V-fold PLP-dependent enzyme [Candidatus Babeliales bacterium]
MKHSIYFDNAASSPTPKPVVDAISHFYLHEYAPVHRGIYQLAEQATARYEGVRAQIARFLHARHVAEIVFTQGATESINLVASTWAMAHLKKGDEILLTEMEHHSNLLPWQRVAERTGAILKFIPILSDGTLEYKALETLVTERTKLIAVVHVSNGLGTRNDIGQITKHAQRVGAKMLIDACQSVPHQQINVQKLQCDFLVFSAHKMLGPTGVGILYIKKELHDETPPYELGGGMVYRADWHSATYLPAPRKFEAGTPPIAQVIGLGAAITLIESTDRSVQQQLEASLCRATLEGLKKIPGVHIYGPHQELAQHGHLVSFNIDGFHPHDIAAFLDTKNICVRAGDFCLQPMWRKWGIAGAVRVSFYYGNTMAQVEQFVQALFMLVGR